MHNDPLLQILILLTASVCVVAGGAQAEAAGDSRISRGRHAARPARARRWRPTTETTRLLADFGVVFLVFTLGLEFSLPRLVAMRWEVLGVGGAQVLVTTGIVAAGARHALRRRRPRWRS